MPTIDWEALARGLGTVRDDGSESCGSDTANLALEQIIGTETLRAAVDHYVARKPGSELVRNVLWVLHPWSAMQRCYEIYRTATDAEGRCTAVELLRVVADRRALAWVAEFLADADAGIQVWGASMLDQLLFSSLIQPDQCTDLLAAMAVHPNENVRDAHAFIQEYLTERGRWDEAED